MSLKLGLVGFPLFMMFVLVLINNSAATGNTGLPTNGAVQGFQGGAAAAAVNYPTFSCNDSTVCFPSSFLPAPSKITCSSSTGNGNCALYNGCISPVPDGAFCAYILAVIPYQTQMKQGTTIFVDSKGGTTSSSNTASSTFSFGAIGPAGFGIMITVAIGVAVLAGFTVFGSGENQESIHILFMGGLLLGLWAILTAAEGFPSGNVNSFFVGLNSSLSGLGDVTYIAISLVYVLGVAGTISRGQ